MLHRAHENAYALECFGILFVIRVQILESALYPCVRSQRTEVDVTSQDIEDLTHHVLDVILLAGTIIAGQSIFSPSIDVLCHEDG